LKEEKKNDPNINMSKTDSKIITTSNSPIVDRLK